MFLVHLVLALCIKMKFSLAVADIKGSYKHIGPITSNIYVRPPDLPQNQRSISFNLENIPYVITEGG